MTGMEHDIRVRKNNSKFGGLYLLGFWARQLSSQKSRSAVHAVWLVVGCWCLGLLWIYFFSHSFPVNTAHSQWIVGCTGVQQSLSFGAEPLHKASGRSVFGPCIALLWGEPGCGHVLGQGSGWAALWQRTAALQLSGYFLTLDNIRIKRHLSFAPQVNLRQTFWIKVISL